MKLKASMISPAMALILLFPLAATALAAEKPEELVPMGQVVGINVKAEGVEISELSYIETDNGSISPAGAAGLCAGDIIINVGGKTVTSVAELTKALKSANGKELTVIYKRNGTEHRTALTPYVKDGEPIIGIWAKDGISGIGTLTFYDPDANVFGALGHSVSENSDPEAYSIGTIHPALVSGIVEGKAGAPGQLGGTMDMSTVEGEITRNSDAGIFGKLSDISEICSDPIPVAAKSEIKEGPACILSAASGTVKEYSIEIMRVYPASDDMRTMLIKITDNELCALTGGIVQGMSGSPIIQNGKLIGAVTHVLIADPLKGYGISIEEMLNECENARLYDRAA